VGKRGTLYIRSLIEALLDSFLKKEIKNNACIDDSDVIYYKSCCWERRRQRKQSWSL